MEQLKNIEMLTDKIRFKWMKQYRVISENIVLCVSLRHALCIEVNFEIIGFILAFQIPDTVIEYGVFIDNVAIDPCKQRRGYGLEAMKKDVLC